MRGAGGTNSREPAFQAGDTAVPRASCCGRWTDQALTKSRGEFLCACRLRGRHRLLGLLSSIRIPTIGELAKQALGLGMARLFSQKGAQNPARPTAITLPGPQARVGQRLHHRVDSSSETGRWNGALPPDAKRPAESAGRP